MTLTMDSLQAKAEVHRLRTSTVCDKLQVINIVEVGQLRVKHAALSDGTVLNPMTIRHYHLGSECPNKKQVNFKNLTSGQNAKTWHVPSSSGRSKEPYTVTLSASGHWSCDCTAGTYHRLCRHVKLIAEKIGVTVGPNLHTIEEVKE